MAEAVGVGGIPSHSGGAGWRRIRWPRPLLVLAHLLIRGAQRGYLLVAGRLLLLLGVLIALFIVFELFLTPLVAWRAQDALLSSFKQEIVTTTLDRPAVEPAEGSAVAVLEIPRIGLNQVVAEGTTPNDLKSGPGHLRAAPIPGEFGNSVIAGRRTTYGAPFGRLSVLAKGDTIRVITGQGLFTYVVRSVRHIVPGQSDPIMGTSDSRLTLITSDPAYLATGRLAVVATLKGLPTAVSQRPPRLVGDSDLGLAGDTLGLGLGMFWGELLLVVLFIGWRQRGRWPAAVIYLIAAPLALALIVLTFSTLDLLLPGTA